MAVFILIHGAWYGGWCWERIVPMIEAAGHRVLAPDLPGTGNGNTQFPPDVMSRWADFTADLIRAQSEPVILAGHSRGGIIISEAAERAPDRIATLAYIAAFLMPAGMSVRELQAEGGEDQSRVQIDPASGTCTINPASRRSMLFGLCSDEYAGAAVDRLCAEPLASMGHVMQLSDERFGTVPRAYIETSQDGAIMLARQRAMQTMLPCNPVFTLESDHSPFYSAPRELVEALLSLVPSK